MADIHSDINRWFHQTADEGKVITRRRRELARAGIYVTARSVALLIRLERIKKQFYGKP